MKRIFLIIILQFCFLNANAFNLTRMNSLTLSKIIMNRQQQHKNYDNNQNDVYVAKTYENSGELGTILESRISGNFKLWHLIIIVLFAWIIFLFILCVVVNMMHRFIKRQKEAREYKRKKLRRLCKNIYIQPEQLSSLSISSKVDGDTINANTSLAEMTGGAHTNFIHCFSVNDDEQLSIEERERLFQKV